MSGRAMPQRAVMPSTGQRRDMACRSRPAAITYPITQWHGREHLISNVRSSTATTTVWAFRFIRCSKSVNKSLSASTSGSTQGVVNFYAPYTGYYHFRWTPVADQYGNAGTWLEVVFGHIKIQQGTASAKSSNLFGETTAIGSIRATDEKQLTYGIIYRASV